MSQEIFIFKESKFSHETPKLSLFFMNQSFSFFLFQSYCWKSSSEKFNNIKTMLAAALMICCLWSARLWIYVCCVFSVFLIERIFCARFFFVLSDRFFLRFPIVWRLRRSVTLPRTRIDRKTLLFFLSFMRRLLDSSNAVWYHRRSWNSSDFLQYCLIDF